MGGYGGNVTGRLLLFAVLFGQYTFQRTDRCSVPCELGFSCYTDGFREPRCIPMAMYLSIMQGQSHDHTGPEIRQSRRGRNRLNTFDSGFGQNTMGPSWQPTERIQPRLFEDRQSRFGGDRMITPRFPETRQFQGEMDAFTNTQMFRDSPSSTGLADTRFFPGEMDRPTNTPPFRDSPALNPSRDISSTHFRDSSTNMRRNPSSERPVSRVFVDPNTGERFALVPLNQETSGTTFPQRPSALNTNSIEAWTNIQRSDQSTRGSSDLSWSPDPVPRVPTANTFENQFPDSNVNSLKQVASATPIKQNLSPVGPLTNTRTKSVSEIIEEFISPAMRANNVNQQNETIEPDGVVDTHHVTDNRHVTDTPRVPAAVQARSKSVSEIIEEFTRPVSRRSNINHHVVNLEPVEGHAVDTPHVTEAPPVHTTVNSPAVQTDGRVSSILRDEHGYHYIFYSQPAGEDGIRVNITKTGFCARNPPSRQSVQCNIWCSSDEQCLDDLKCCPNGCGLKCTPIRGSGTAK